MLRYSILGAILAVIFIIVFNIFSGRFIPIKITPISLTNVKPTLTPSRTPTPEQEKIPNSVYLNNDYHVFQSFNNCGPAALSMALSYYGVNETQKTLGDELRPFQNPQGDNDDKSVTLEELAEKSKDYNLTPYHRPAGNNEIIKRFISLKVPVITRTLLNENEDIGHFRVIKGYDDLSQEFIQDDSLQGKNLRYSYTNFDILWKTFGYEYLVLVPSDKIEKAELILGKYLDEKVAWKNAEVNAHQHLRETPDDIYARLNLVVALHHLENYKEAIVEFEKIKDRLPFRTLWYQIEPIESYFALGKYDEVFTMTDKILNYYNRAYSELYVIRGNIYKIRGDNLSAKQEYEKAIFYNQNLKSARQAMEQLN